MAVGPHSPPSRAGSECAAFRCEAMRCDARGPRFSAGYGGDVVGGLRGAGGSLPPASPPRNTGTPETKNKINKLSPPPPSPKTTTQTLGGPPRVPLHWPQGGCFRLSLAGFYAHQAAVPPLQFLAAAVAPHWSSASRLTSYDWLNCLRQSFGDTPPQHPRGRFLGRGPGEAKGKLEHDGGRAHLAQPSSFFLF